MKTRYFEASSGQQGALAVFHAYGPEEALARALDAALSLQPLSPGALRYGWLRDGDGEVIDEVLLACPAINSRVLMTHGGRILREEVRGYFEANGFVPLGEKEIAEAAADDPVLEPLLSACVTEGQAAHVLGVRACAGTGAMHPEDAAALADSLRPRRVVLAGAPNAGKSSLLNALAGYDRAFVDPEAGATRDVVDELVDIAGYAVWVGDMPGYVGGGCADSLAAEIWAGALRRIRLADEVWFVLDGAAGWTAGAAAAAAAVASAMEGVPRAVRVVISKSDLPLRLVGEPWRAHFPAASAVRLCTLPGGDARERVEDAEFLHDFF